MNDPFLKKELCDLEGVQTFKSYFDHAILAENKRKFFNEIGTSSASLDAASGISINKWDISGKAASNFKGKTGGTNNKNNGNSNKNGNFGGNGNFSGNKSGGSNGSSGRIIETWQQPWQQRQVWWFE